MDKHVDCPFCGYKSELQCEIGRFVQPTTESVRSRCYRISYKCYQCTMIFIPVGEDEYPDWVFEPYTPPRQEMIERQYHIISRRYGTECRLSSLRG
jgi:hypothetical protein